MMNILLIYIFRLVLNSVRTQSAYLLYNTHYFCTDYTAGMPELPLKSRDFGMPVFMMAHHETKISTLRRRILSVKFKISNI